MCDCSFQIGCSWCAFCNEDGNCCERNKTKWLNEEYVEPKVDWSKVPVDTPVLVSKNGSTWFKRYFAGFDKGIVSAWNQGATSWSSDFDDDNTTKWTYAKLAESNVGKDDKQTNADRIRNMSDEELAEFLVGFKNTFGEEYEGEASCMEWLQSEAE